MSTTVPSVIDVLVVGAGPVGLLAANLVKQAGLSVRILDIEHEPNHWGRGDWIHGRTLELLQSAGLESELLRTGVKVEHVATYVNRKPQSRIALVPEQAESSHEFLLCVGQHITEASLQSQLSNQDVQVERPSTVVSMAEVEGEHPVRATVKHLLNDDATEEIKCKYILGCDGAHSDIRRQLGIENEGDTTEIHAGVIDALVRTNFTNGRKDVCILQNDSAKTVSLFPRENGLTRVFVHFSKDEHDMRKEQHNRNKIQLEDIQREAKRALLPCRLEFLGILYWSVYVVGQHLASRIDALDRRVFLLGDAAHSQSPTLGQGLNTGFGDVFNLIWKLEMVERGKLRPDILSTFGPERLSVARQVLAVDKVVSRAAAGHQSDDYCDAIQMNRAFTTGFGIRYNATEDNALIWAEENYDTYNLQPGMRAPNYKVVSYTTKRKARVLDRHTWLAFTLIVLAGDLGATAESVQAFMAWVESNKETLPPVHIVIVTTSTAEGVAACKDHLGDTILLDKLNQHQCHTGYNMQINKQSIDAKEKRGMQVVVVRPDGHIGTIARPRQQETPSRLVQTYFERCSAL